ncbi:hypothetical protein A3715_19355 [Oleiphilus sp. HI0009]|nr:hypothetical protein A3715_10660 [Oleiphilus sp. HI0009]KZX80623.1 hypothetical protein A3715_19355 [Oleiphilus sp. HI0009]
MQEIILLNQEDIGLSDNCVSLFLGDTHLYDKDSFNEIDIDALATSLGVALKQSVKEISVSKEEFAYSCARQSKMLNELCDVMKNNGEVEEFVQGYGNDALKQWLKDNEG